MDTMATLIQLYGYQKKTTLAYIFSIDIQEAEFEITEQNLKIINSEKGLKSLSEDLGDYVEGAKTTIKGLAGNEIVIKKNSLKEN